MIVYGLAVSAATNSSLNTAFSAVATNLPLAYQFGIWNLTSGVIGIAIETSLPTNSTTNQILIPSNGTYAYDSNHGQPAVSSGQNLYMRVNSGTVALVSGTVLADFAQ